LLALARRATVVDSRSGWCVAGAAAGWVGSAAALAALKDLARPTARAASMMPCPAPGTAVRAAVVPLVSAWLTWDAVRCGNRDTRRAATPATMPLDALVELIRV
jgi:hypothetical protein